MNQCQSLTKLLIAIVSGLLSLPLSLQAQSLKSFGLAAVVIDPDIGNLSVIEYAQSKKQELIALGAEVSPGYRVTQISSQGIIIKSKVEERFIKVGENVSLESAQISSHELNQIHHAANTWESLFALVGNIVTNSKYAIKEGRLTGAVLIPFKPAGYLKNLGLQKDDVILELNGAKPASFNDESVKELFGSSATLEIMIERAGSVQVLTFDPLST